MRNDVPGGVSSLLVPPTGVGKAGGARARVLIEQLREQIRALEQVPVSLVIPPAPGAAPPHPACFLPRPGALPGPLGKLKNGGLHEIRPESYRDRPAALCFALALIAEQAAGQVAGRDLVLWCFTHQAAREWGCPYGPGLLVLGLDPALFLLVEARNTGDAAWALEEGLKSGALIAALAEIEIKTPLTARRLSLAAQASRTPCLLLSGSQQVALPGTLTSWRIAAMASRAAPFDASAPGTPFWHLTLERCRGEAPGRSFIVEYSHGSFHFHLSPASSARAADKGENSERRRAVRR